MAIRHEAVTPKKIEQKIAHGDGQGTGENYRPWIRVGDFASQGRTHRICGLDGRIHHFFSDLERCYYYHLIWEDAVIDIQEQYPLLPLETTQGIANTLGFAHPIDPKTRYPIVMTTDFLVTVCEEAEIHQIARCVKYEKELRNERACQKLQIEKQYWENQNVQWSIVTEASFDQVRSKNIQFLMGYYQDEIIDAIPDEILMILIDALAVAPQKRIAMIGADIDERLSLSSGSALRAIYYFAAHKILPARLDCRWNDWRVSEILDAEKLAVLQRKGCTYGQNAVSG